MPCRLRLHRHREYAHDQREASESLLHGVSLSAA
jgi:hypothetical protein